jgi:hypothetical protein
MDRDLFLQIQSRSLVSLLALALFLSALIPAKARAESPVVARHVEAQSAIVIGFVGGFVRHTNLRHGAVLTARRIESEIPGQAEVMVFENRHRKSAYRAILRLLDRNHDGVLSPDERKNARIILFGQSWGASAVVMLARELNHERIPVLLTVQVDSVAKPWQEDSIIPTNVAEAVNFYQPHGLIHGRAQIRAADPMRTQILGNFRIDYHKDPVDCTAPSWADHLFTPDHAMSECDPRLWGKIEDLVRQRLMPESASIETAFPRQP